MLLRKKIKSKKKCGFLLLTSLLAVFSTEGSGGSGGGGGGGAKRPFTPKAAVRPAIPKEPTLQEWVRSCQLLPQNRSL
jgi:hypothetical protein